MSKVLSEGEHRCVALAAFMAELATTENTSGIVFDDPVSSLDHIHRKVVAKRLVDAANQRQVIVFTHDLEFLILLREASRHRQGNDPTFMSVIKVGQKAGICGESPFKALSVKERVDWMKKTLKNGTEELLKGNTKEWDDYCKNIYSSLRQTWEAAVEEVVSPVIKRLHHKVDTSKLCELAEITPDDAEKMREEFVLCSVQMHDSPAASNPPTPKPEEVEERIDKLNDWYKDLKSRQAAASKTRNARNSAREAGPHRRRLS